jgi:hypothetical protein
LSFLAGKAGRFSTGVVTAITLAACATKGGAPITKDSAENQATLRKLEGYIVCLEMAHHTFEVADRYRERYAAHPPAATDDTPVQPASDPEECTGDVLRAVQLDPKLPELDAAGRAYLDAETETYALTVAMHDAFDHASLSYNPAAGIALHPRVLAAFDHFDAAQAALFDQVFALNHKIHVDQLARRTKDEGRTLAVMLEEMVVRAEALIPYASVSSDRLDAVDLDAMTNAIIALQSSLDEVTAFADLHQKDASALLKGFWEIPRSAKDYVFAARQLVARARDHVAYTDAEKLEIAAHNEGAVVGTPAAMIDAYNHLLDVYTPAGSWPR